MKRLAATFVLTLALTAGGARASQQYEPLADSVRAALHLAISDRAAPDLPAFSSPQRQLWLGTMSERLAKRMPDEAGRMEFLKTVHYEATRAGLDPQLVLGLIQVESGFRKYAVSSAGARGYMQVMPFWTRVLADGDASKLFHMQTNLRFGCVILRHYLDRERGDLFLGLGRYNGSRGQAAYPQAVLAAQQQWVHAAD